MTRAKQVLDFINQTNEVLKIPAPGVKAIKKWAKDEAEAIQEGLIDDGRLSELDLSSTFWDQFDVDSAEDMNELILDQMLLDLSKELKKRA